jgi:hypothetical protein
MTKGNGAETPSSKIATALATLYLAIRFNGEVNGGRIDVSIYQRDVVIRTGGPDLLLPSFPEATLDDLGAGAGNIVQIALGASALSADEALLDVFGPLASIADPNLLGIRVMINQMRNAFAHNPWRPKWVIRKAYRRVYPIVLDDGVEFTFDATNLDGDGLMPDQFGDLKCWVDLLLHCERLVASHPDHV